MALDVALRLSASVIATPEQKTLGCAADNIDPVSECQKTDGSCFHNFSDLIRRLPGRVNPRKHILFGSGQHGHVRMW
jgi:hypothetical protein